MKALSVLRMSETSGVPDQVCQQDSVTPTVWVLKSPIIVTLVHRESLDRPLWCGLTRLNPHPVLSFSFVRCFRVLVSLLRNFRMASVVPRQLEPRAARGSAAGGAASPAAAQTTRALPSLHRRGVQKVSCVVHSFTRSDPRTLARIQRDGICKMT